MNLHESNKTAMIDETIFLYNSEKEKFNKFKRIPVTMERIITARGEIGKCEKTLTEGTEGKTGAKTVTKDDLIDLAVIVYGDVFEYASGAGDVELINFSDQNESKLYGLSDSAFKSNMSSLDEKLDSLGTKLDDTDLTADVRANFKTSLLSFLDKAGTAGNARGSVTSARERMTELFHQIDKDLDILDRQMPKFRKDDPDLYSRYISARKIIDRGGSHKTEAAPQTTEQPK